jgi:hypothetical protein
MGDSKAPRSLALLRSLAGKHQVYPSTTLMLNLAVELEAELAKANRKIEELEKQVEELHGVIASISHARFG